MSIENPDTFDALNIEAVFSELTVGLTAVQVKVGASNLDDRKLVIIQPKDGDIFLGYSNSVSIVTGMRLFKDGAVLLPVGEAVSIWLISNSSGKKVSIAELA